MSIFSSAKLLGSLEHFRVTNLSLHEQQELVQAARQVVQQAPLYRAELRGVAFRYHQTGAGWGWTSGHGGGYRYQREHPLTGRPLPQIPESLLRLGQQYGLEADALLINWYTEGSTLGLHQDRDERDLSAPVVSISLGDACIFRLGGTSRSDPVSEHRLESGDVIVLSGPTRLAFHGVAQILPGTAPNGLLHSPGRLNLTLRRSQ